MFLSKTSDAQSHRPNVVGVIDSPRALEAALKLKPGDVDLLEVRVDMFAGKPTKLLSTIQDLAHPLVVTVRHPHEGGANGLPASRRRELFHLFLPHAAMLDVELRSLETLKDVIAAARAANVLLIHSFHNFQSTPPESRLFELARRALLARADVFKLAAQTNTPTDLARLLTFLSKQKRIHIGIMGMGRFGKVSRLVFAQAGSVLNYGYLDRPQVSGQWSALELKKRIDELINAG
jgi:3-dehydroquinate dehydratase-1